MKYLCNHNSNEIRITCPYHGLYLGSIGSFSYNPGYVLIAPYLLPKYCHPIYRVSSKFFLKTSSSALVALAKFRTSLAYLYTSIVTDIVLYVVLHSIPNAFRYFKVRLRSPRLMGSSLPSK